MILFARCSVLRIRLNVLSWNLTQPCGAQLRRFPNYSRGIITAKLPFELETNVPKDVVLFKYENPRLYRLLNIFALSQFIFWTYLSHFAFTSLRDLNKMEEEHRLVPYSKESPNGLEWWKKINLGENKYRYGLTTLCFSIGFLILACSWIFTLRTVRVLTLLKDGQQIQIICYAPFGDRRTINTSLDNVTCGFSRGHVSTHLPLKVRNHWMYFLIDQRGTFLNPRLFDYTAGVKRTWKK